MSVPPNPVDPTPRSTIDSSGSEAGERGGAPSGEARPPPRDEAPAPPAAPPAPRAQTEMASLAERMGYLQALRATFGIVVLISALYADEVIRVNLSDLLLATGGYLFVSAAAEGARRISRGRGLPLVAGMLLIDGAYLGFVQYLTGGSVSQLRFLILIHLVAVTLLASYRTGLKIALWHTLVFFVIFYAQASGVIRDVEGIAGDNVSQNQYFNTAAFWFVALVTAVFSALNERELRQRKEDLEALAAMASRMEEKTTPEAVAQTLLEDVCAHFDFPRGLVSGGSDPDNPELLAWSGPEDPVETVPGVDGAMRRAWETHETLLLAKFDPVTDPRLSLLLPAARNVIVCPLFAEGTPLGVLVVETGRRHTMRIERRVVRMVEQFCAHGSLALRNVWLLGEIQKMAETDALTGVANRRTFEQVLEAELSRASRNQEELTLVMVDIDHFKSLNDTYGHQVGDDVLRGIAAELSVHCRDFDTIARYGGEEFAVILPSCTTREAPLVADRLRRAVSDVRAVVPVTASAGVATFPHQAVDGASLIKTADDALYESKRAGRNRVTVSRRRVQPQAPRSEGSEPAAAEGTTTL